MTEEAAFKRDKALTESELEEDFSDIGECEFAEVYKDSDHSNPSWQPDPYQKELFDDNTLHFICGDCADKLGEDI